MSDQKLSLKQKRDLRNKNFKPVVRSVDSRVKRVLHPDCSEDGVTEQHHVNEVDIKTILKRHGMGEIDPNRLIPNFTGLTFGDGSPLDYHGMMSVVAQAKGSFSTLPAETRAFFLNDMDLFVKFCSDPANAKKMSELGLSTAHLVLPTGESSSVATPVQPAQAAPAAAGSSAAQPAAAGV